jgi:hypothetical protein
MEIVGSTDFTEAVLWMADAHCLIQLHNVTVIVNVDPFGTSAFGTLIGDLTELRVKPIHVRLLVLPFSDI